MAGCTAADLTIEVKGATTVTTSFPVTPGQVETLARWVYTGTDAASTQLESQDDGSLLAIQGDDHVLIEQHGRAIPLDIRHPDKDEARDPARAARLDTERGNQSVSDQYRTTDAQIGQRVKDALALLDRVDMVADSIAAVVEAQDAYYHETGEPQPRLQHAWIVRAELRQARICLSRLGGLVDTGHGS